MSENLQLISMSKKEILSVYRRILRVARSWEASSGRAEDTSEERSYIANECRELFRQNSKVFHRFILHFLHVLYYCKFLLIDIIVVNFNYGIHNFYCYFKFSISKSAKGTRNYTVFVEFVTKKMAKYREYKARISRINTW